MDFYNCVKVDNKVSSPFFSLLFPEIYVDCPTGFFKLFKKINFLFFSQIYVNSPLEFLKLSGKKV